MSQNLVYRDEQRRVELEPFCREVLRYFTLPSQDLICVFDNEERPEFLERPGFGPNFCGFFYPFRLFGLNGDLWPQEVLEHISDPWNGKAFLCDVVIYLRKRTCDSRIGAVITFAHELQHFMQFGYNRKAWRANQYIQDLVVPKLLNPRPWHFPVEHEAQLVSKRIAEIVLGQKEVTRYAEDQIAINSDPEKWKFFLDLEIKDSDEFDLMQSTDVWVRQYRADLEMRFRLSENEKSEPNFAVENWWV